MAMRRMVTEPVFGYKNGTSYDHSRTTKQVSTALGSECHPGFEYHDALCSLYVCMCIYIYIYVLIYMYLYVYTSALKYLHVGTLRRTYMLYIHTHTHTHTHTYFYPSICLPTYLSIYVSIYLPIYLYRPIYLSIYLSIYIEVLGVLGCRIWGLSGLVTCLGAP